MKRLLKALMVALLILLIAAGTLYYEKGPDGLQDAIDSITGKGEEPLPEVASFEECVAAGYPVMESYPRQCRTLDGQTFTEDVTISCSADTDCPQGSYCAAGECARFSISADCSSDADCTLINSEYLLGCCYAGVCDEIDYSQGGWIAVSRADYNEKKAENCPSLEECGPSPMCPTRVKNDSFSARCLGGTCRKLSHSDNCAYGCGDGICQELSCEDWGCLCAETEKSCPQDCSGESTGIANPASVNCVKNGGKVEIRTDASGGQYGVCVFLDGSECDEWAYYRGQCTPKSKVTTSTRPAAREIDTRCETDADCALKKVGSLADLEYEMCVNVDFEPRPPEIQSKIIRYEEVDGCACTYNRCAETLGGTVYEN